MHCVAHNSSISTLTISTGIVFIDSSVDDYETLMAGVKPGLEVVLLDVSSDGIAQITQFLKGRSGLSSLHIVAHGDAGELWVGSGFINSNTLEQYSDDLLSWAAALAPDADILLYGCNVAAGETGQQFVQLLSQLTGADVAASNNLTGSAALGGDWELEVKIGTVEAAIAFGAETMDAYSAVLTTRRVSVASDGTQGNGNSYLPIISVTSISADGRYVAFQSKASNLVSGDTNNAHDIFVYDRQTNTTRRVSVDDNGTEGNSFSYRPSISADGRYVAFQSYASNLVSGDTNRDWDIFVYDQQTNTTRRVSVDYSGSNFSDPSISADGRYVAFEGNTYNLMSGSTRNILVYDTVANTTRRVSVDSNGTQGNSGSERPSISADGRYVAFTSAASNLVSGDTNGTYDIFVYDTLANTTRRVSVDSNGTQGNNESREVSISADGRYVAFTSAASNLVSGDTNYAEDIFVYNTVSNTTRRVSVDSNGFQGNSFSLRPSISADGRYVTFQSYASNLVSGDTNNAPDIFVYDQQTNTTRRVSVDSNGTQGNGTSDIPSISADGSYVAFASYASNLVSGDTNNAADIFVYERGYGTQNPWTGTPFDDSYTYTGTANFTGNGLAGNDTIVGGIGNNILDGGLGNDSLMGGAGNDTIIGGIGNDTINSGLSNDSLMGGAGNDTIIGGIGNDTINGGAGADSLDGGDNIDTLSYADSTAGVNVNLATNTVSGGDATGDIILNFENVTGSSYNDSIIGSSASNTLNGGAGNDTLDGGDGDDLIYFGDGDDYLDIVSGGNDTFYGGSGNDSIYGYYGNETYYGEAGNDTLKGYYGNDTISGGVGADSLDGGADTDTLSYAGSTAGVSVNLATNTVSGGDATGDIIANFENVAGSSFNDTLTGSSGNNLLDGGLGNDSLIGGAGNDTYYVDSRSDVVTENLNEGTDTVYSSVHYLLRNNVENLTLTGSATQGIGNSLDNIITGNSQANHFRGGLGNDTIYGADGNDNLNGNDGNDQLYGGEGNDFLTGEQGNDLLSGGSGNDILVGYGNTSGEIDTLSGGAGSDIFGIGVNFARYGGGSGGVVGYTGVGNTGYALIQDLESTDFIELQGGFSLYSFGQAYNYGDVNKADLTISYNGSNGPDLIAVVQDSINVTSSNFIFFT